MPNFIDETGNRYGRLLVIRHVPKPEHPKGWSEEDMIEELKFLGYTIAEKKAKR